MIEELKKSYFFKEIMKEISNDKNEIVSFDIYDTLLRRDCNKPIDIFSRVGDRAGKEGVLNDLDSEFFLKKRIYAEEKSRIESNREEISIFEIYSYMDLSDSEVEKLIEIELEEESSSYFQDLFIKEVVDICLDKGKKIIVSSDIYLPKDFVVENVLRFYPELSAANFYVSSDLGVTKYSSNMFSYIKEQEGVSIESILHIGDSHRSDSKSMIDLGGRSVLYNLNKDILDVFERESFMGKEIDYLIDLARFYSAILNPFDIETEDGFFYCYSALFLSPVITGFMKWIESHCMSKEINNVLLLMREGDSFKNVCDFLGYSGSYKRFYASRKSTFIPSINVDSISNSLESFFKRSDYRLIDLYSEFGLEVPEVLSMYSNSFLHGGKIEFVEGETLVQSAFRDILSRKEEVKSYSEEQKSTFMRYFNNFLEEGSVAVVDLGGGATISNQMNKAGANIDYNFLLYSSRRAYMNTSGINVYSFLKGTESEISALERSPEIIETPLVGYGGSTIRYDYKGECVIPVLDSTVAENRMREVVYEGMRNYVKISLSLNTKENSEESRKAFCKIVNRIVSFPTKREADFLGGLEHELNFGSESTKLISPNVDIENGNLEYRNFLSGKSKKFKSILWPQGSFTRKDSEIISDYMVYSGLDKKKHNLDISDIIFEIDKSGVESVYVFGAGEFFENLYPALKSINVNIVAVYDSKVVEDSFFVKGVPVFSPNKIKDIDVGDEVPVFVVASRAFYEDICFVISSFLDKVEII